MLPIVEAQLFKIYHMTVKTMGRHSLLLVLFLLALHNTHAEKLFRFWQWYKSSLSKQPLRTKAVTACGIMILSDAISQHFEAAAHQNSFAREVRTRATKTSSSSRIQHDWRRTRDVALTGLTWSGPISHTWHGILEALVRTDNRVKGVAFRLILDTVIFSPVGGMYLRSKRAPMFGAEIPFPTSYVLRSTFFSSGRIFYMENSARR